MTRFAEAANRCSDLFLLALERCALNAPRRPAAVEESGPARAVAPVIARCAVPRSDDAALVFPARHNRKLAPHDRGALEIAGRGRAAAVATIAETVSIDNGHAVAVPGVAVVVDDVDAVVNKDGGVVASTTAAKAVAEAPPVPGVIAFAGRQRHPTHVAEANAEAEAAPATVAEEAH